MLNKAIVAVIAVAVVALGLFLIVGKTNEISDLKVEVSILEDENSGLTQELSDLTTEKNTLSEELRIFIEGCSFQKDGCATVRSLKTNELLKSNNIVEAYLSFNTVANGKDSLEELYEQSQDNPQTLTIIEEQCGSEYYEPSIEGREERTREPILVAKKSFVVEIITDRDASIQSNLWRQKAFVVFNDQYDIVCAWKLEKSVDNPGIVYSGLS